MAKCIIPDVYKLNITEDLNLVDKNKKFLKGMNDICAKLWCIKKKIRYKTLKSQTGKKIKNPTFPIGLHVFEKVVDNKLLDLCYDELGILYNTYKKLNIPFADYTSRKLLYLFTRPQNSTVQNDLEYDILLRDKALYTLKKIDHLPNLYKFCVKSVDYIIKIYAKLFKVSKFEILKHTKCSFIRYAPNTGIWMHIDNIKRESVALYNINISKEKFYPMDLIPITVKGKPIRLHINTGDFVSLSSVSRFQYSHGIPYNFFKNVKYTFMIRIENIPNSVNNNSLLYDDILEYNIPKPIIKCL
jgi:hypothetical protein